MTVASRALGSEAWRFDMLPETRGWNSHHSISLAVDPAGQGTGVGRALVETCIARARAQGRRRVILHSTPVMVKAQSLYKRLGFQAAPELDVWFTGEPYSASEPLHLIAFILSL